MKPIYCITVNFRRYISTDKDALKDLCWLFSFVIDEEKDIKIVGESEEAINLERV